MAGTNETTGGRRLPVLQALIVFAVAGLVAALAIPAFAARAKTSVLRQNQTELAQQVRTHVVLDVDTTHAPESSSSTGTGLAAAAALGGALRSGADGRYVNPCSGSSAVVCSSAPPATRPAVWLTDDANYVSAAFTPSRLTGSQLAGTLVIAAVVRNGTATINISYIDAHGERSPSVETLTAPAAAWHE